MNIKQRIGVLLLISALGTPLFAQTPVNSSEERLEQLIQNQEKLKIVLEMDRSEYFPGELAELTIRVRNPTTEVLEVPTPFSGVTGRIWLSEKGNSLAKSHGTEYGHTAEPESEAPLPQTELAAPSLIPIAVPSIHLAAGQEIARTYQFYELQGDTVAFDSIPVRAGQFRFEYLGATVDFQVVLPVFEGLVKIELPGLEAPGTKETRATYAFVLGSKGKHFVCLEKVPLPGPLSRIWKEADGQLTDGGLPFVRYARLFESDAPIVSLQGESDNNRNITLRWGKDGENKRSFLENEWRIPDPKVSKSAQ